MFCIFCGKKIDPSKQVCPFCGQPQEARSGGNGFWDILAHQPKDMEAVRESAPQPAMPPQKTPPHIAAANVRRKRNAQLQRSVSITVAALLLVLIGLEISAFAAILRQDQELKKLEQEMNQMSQRINSLEQQLVEIQPAQQEFPIPEAPSPVSTEPQPVGNGIINVQPKDCQWGMTNNQFDIEYATKEATPRWEYLDGQGNWQIIDPDQDERFKQIPGEGNSTLQILGEDEELFTQYRCVLRIGDGSEIKSDWVRLLKPQATDDVELAQTQP